MIQALKDPNVDVRDNVTNALEKIGKSAVEPLIQALRDENASLRAFVATALGDTNDSRALEPLEKALKDQDEKVRISAMAALEHMENRTVNRVSSNSQLIKVKDHG